MKKYVIITLGIIIIGIALVIYKLQSGISITISEEELRNKIEEIFPLKKTHYGILKVTYSDPVISIIDDSDKIRIGLTATPEIKINDNKHSGSALVQGRFRYDPNKGQFFIKDFTVENISISGVNIDKMKIVNALSSELNEIYEKIPVYTLKDNDLKQKTAKMIVRKISISNKMIKIEFGL